MGVFIRINRTPAKDHGCITKIRENWIKDEPEITAVDFDLDNIQDMSKGGGEYKTGQPVTFWKKVINKRTGKEAEKKFKSFVTHTYCPFCGKKYE